LVTYTVAGLLGYGNLGLESCGIRVYPLQLAEMSVENPHDLAKLMMVAN
jgi:hypothetical protein